MQKRRWPYSWNLLTKIVAINLVVLAVSFLALSLYVLPLYEDTLRGHRKNYITSSVHMAAQILSRYYQLEQSGEFSRQQAQQRAFTTMLIMRHNNDYFWVHSLDYKVVAHPYDRTLSGQDISKVVDARGKLLFVEMNRLVRERGEGFVEYYWPKPGAGDPVAKLSYVKLFKPWGVVVGSGMYLDDIESEVTSLRNKVYVLVALLFLGIIGFSVAAAVRIKRPIQQALELLQGVPEQYRPRSDEVTSFDESGRLLQSMVMLASTLARDKDEAEAKNAAKGAFLAQLSHEIRTPMNAIKGLCELMRDGEIPAQQQELLQGIRHSSDHLLSLVNQVLDFSKLEAGSVEVEQVPFDLRQMFDAALLPFVLKSRSKGLWFETSYAATLPSRIEGDPVKLRQIVVNLVGNAIKFTRKGGITVTVDGVALADERFELVINITDTGIGIAQEKLERMFEPYTQAECSTTREFGGTGLGLSIVRRLLDAMGGRVSVESRQYTGSSFQVRVPVVPLIDVTPPLAESVWVPQQVLLAEDSDVSRLMLVRLLERLGHQVDAVPDGRAAVERWKQGGYTVILMDVQMPELDGMEAARLIRSLEAVGDSHIPIVAMTGLSELKDQDACLQAGMDYLLVKPVEGLELAELLQRISQQQDR